MWYREATYAGRSTGRFSVARRSIAMAYGHIYADEKSNYSTLVCLVLHFFHKPCISKIPSLFFPALLLTPSFSFPFDYQRGFRLNPLHFMDTLISRDKALHSPANGRFIQTFYRNRKLNSKSGNRKGQGRGKKQQYLKIFPPINRSSY